MKEILLNILQGIGNFIPFSSLQALTNKKLVLPFYHLVSDERAPHVTQLYKYKNRKQFIQDLDFLLKHYTPIHITELINFLNKGKAVPKNSFLLSFDDGLREFDDVIAPILLQKGIPAVVFLNSAFLDNKDLFFRYKASLLIEKMETSPEKAPKVRKWLSYYGFSENIRNSLLSIDFQNKYLLDELALAADVSFTKFLNTEKPYLTSEQVRNLTEKGFVFGGHSIDHPEYQFIQEEEQLRQTITSVNTAQELTKNEFRLFSFPFTDYKVNGSFFKKIYQHHQLDLSFGTAGLKADPERRNVQRIPFEDNNLTAEQILKREYMYYLLKKPFKKNMIVRNNP